MGIELTDNMSTIQNIQTQTETTMKSTRNYWLIMQNRYGIIDGGYNEDHAVKKIDKLIFDEITDYQILGVTDPIF